MPENTPNLEPHWSPEDWAEQGIERHLLPWWIVMMWLLFLLWGIAYIINSASAW
jgi:hypothetical protein